MIQRIMNSYLNGMLTNQEVIDELMKLAKEIQEGAKQGNVLGLTEEELAFYDALTKPEAIRDFYENDELVALTRELTETLRKNKQIDWQKRNAARARMRMMIKRLLKKYKYPPEGMEDALETVMTQCELWTDNNDMEAEERQREAVSSMHRTMPEQASEKSVEQTLDEAVKKSSKDLSYRYSIPKPDMGMAADTGSENFWNSYPGTENK
jgi:type I restriction enzyme R subunit